MAEANKPEKLGFVRLYNTTAPIANVVLQDPNKLPRMGEIEHSIGMAFVAHYCWEAGLLLVAVHIVDAPNGWFEDTDLRARLTSYHCDTETSAVDRIIRMKREEWSKRCADVELAVYQHKPLRVTRYDADGVIQEDPAPEQAEAEEHDVTFRGDPATLPPALRKIASGKGDEPSVTLSAGGKSVTLKNTDIGPFTKSLGKIANGRKASTIKEGR